MRAISFEKLEIPADGTVVALAALTARPDGKAQAQFAIAVVEGGGIVRYTEDGTAPDQDDEIGQECATGQCFLVSGQGNIKGLQVCSADGVASFLSVRCYDQLPPAGFPFVGVPFDKVIALDSDPRSEGTVLAVTKAQTLDNQLLLPAVAFDRVVHLHVTVDEVFADGNGTQTVITVGNGDDPDAYMLATKLVAAAAAAVFVIAVLVEAGDIMTVSSVAKTGSTGTGGATFRPIAVPATTID